MLFGRVLALVLVVLGTCAPSASAQSSEVRDEEARALFSAGRLAFEAGDYEHALEDFRQAYDRSPRPELLFNIAQSADRLRRDEEALSAYRRFLEGVPESPNRPLVEARITFLERASAETSTAPPSEEPPSEEHLGADEATVAQTPPPSASHELDPTGPIVIGAGGAVLVAGAVLLAVGYSDRASVEAARDGTSWASVEGAYGRADAEVTAGFVLVGVGAALAVVGVVITATLGSREDTQVVITPTGLVARGTF